MFVDFFYQLRHARIPVTIREYLMLLEAMEKGAASINVEEFYVLARAAMIKDEKFFDTYDKVFGNFFQGAMNATESLFDKVIPEEWLKNLAERVFDQTDLDQLEAMSFDELMDELAKRLQEQEGRHEGGDRWIGTGGTSPFGNSGRNPSGVRIGGDGGGKSATKVWEKREFKSLDGDIQIGTRNFKIALRRLRKFVRDGAEDEFDLDGTIRATADNAGWLDIRMRPERKNRIKVLLFIDIGGSMDAHVRTCEELFSAARDELKHLEYYYFHNFIYETVWKDNRRRHNERIKTEDVIHKYASDYKIIFVGDATMAPYEITNPGGSIEHWNEEAGSVWMKKIMTTYDKLIWLNPVPEEHWDYSSSIEISRHLIDDNMFPLTLKGLEDGMSFLSKK